MAILIISLEIISGLIVILLIFKSSKRRELLLAITTLLLVVILLEVFLRSYYPQIRKQGGGFEHDNVLGWTQGPNKRVHILFERDNIDHFIESNSHGFRDDEFIVNGTSKKIVVLGDSFVANYAVKSNEVFTEIMESRLENTTVMNLGVPAYNNVQGYLLLKKIMNELKPDLVILVIYVRNDFYENTGVGFEGNARPGAILKENTSEVIILPTPEFQSGKSSEAALWQIYQKFHSYQLIRKRLNKLIYNFKRAAQTTYIPQRHTPPELYLCSKKMSAQVESLYRLMEQLLLVISEFADEQKVPIIFAIAPSIIQIQNKRWLSILDTYNEDSDDYDILLPNKMLMGFAKKHSLNMLDLLPALRAEDAKGVSVYNRYEQHWNKEGNRVAANTLLNYLNRKNTTISRKDYN